MPSAIIENPILNPPYAEPRRRFYFDEDGITGATGVKDAKKTTDPWTGKSGIDAFLDR